MTQEHLEGVLAWLDPAKNPLLVQLPRSEYKKLRSTGSCLLFHGAKRAKRPVHCNGFPPFSAERKRKGWGTAFYRPVWLSVPCPCFFISATGLHPSRRRGSGRGRRSKQLPSLEIDGGALVLEERGFRSQHFKVAGDAALVALVRYLIGMLSRIDGLCSTVDSSPRIRRPESWSSTSLKGA